MGEEWRGRSSLWSEAEYLQRSRASGSDQLFLAWSGQDPGQCLSGAFTEGALCTVPPHVGLPHIPSPQPLGLHTFLKQ